MDTSEAPERKSPASIQAPPARRAGGKRPEVLEHRTFVYLSAPFFLAFRALPSFFILPLGGQAKPQEGAGAHRATAPTGQATGAG